MEMYTLQYLMGTLGHRVIVNQYSRVWKVQIRGSYLRTEDEFIVSGGVKGKITRKATMVWPREMIYGDVKLQQVSPTE